MAGRAPPPTTGHGAGRPVLAGPVQVLRATQLDFSVRIQAVGVTDSQFYDRTLTMEQLRALVCEVAGGARHFDADELTAPA